MDSGSEDEDADLLDHVFLPVAREEDALATATALLPYRPDHVTVLHVIEKGTGVPDKTPVEQSEGLAAESFAAVRTAFPDTDDRAAYARDVVDAIFDVAGEVATSAVAHRFRGSNRVGQFLSGDISLELVTAGNRPVIALPGDDTDE